MRTGRKPRFFTVVDVQRVDAGSVRVVIETVGREAACPDCGLVSSRVKDRPRRPRRSAPWEVVVIDPSAPYAAGIRNMDNYERRTMAHIAVTRAA